MATDTWSSGDLHGSDANFRTWGSELSTKLQAMSGLVKTSDTGQVNWVTVTRPAANTDGGYEIYYLNDSLHGTAPIYFKLYYGTHTSTGNPRIRIEVGTGSNGSGTLTGTGSGLITTANDSAAGSATAQASYLCVNTGFVGLSWKTSGGGGFVICRTCDADGTPNAKGALHLARTGVTSTVTTYTRSLRYEATAAAYPTSAMDPDQGVSFVPAAVTVQNSSGNDQAWVCFGSFPDMRPVFGLATVVAATFAVGSTFSVAMVGSTARTYITLSNANLGYFTAVDDTTWRGAMLWE